MIDIPQDKALKRFQILSDALQDAIFSEKTSASIKKAAVLGNIEDKASDLGKITGYVLLGFLNPINLPKEIEKEFNVSEETANQIYNMLDAEIFSLVEPDLRKLYPPTIKTPTVLSKGFVNTEQKDKHTSEGPTEFEKRFLKKKIEQKNQQQEIQEKKEEKPKKTERYVVDIPEKFKTEKSEDKKITPTEKIMQKPITKPEKTEHQNTTIKQTEPKLKKEPILKSKIEAEKEEESIPDIKPVVPLPTFMKSQFQPRSLNEHKKSAYQEDVPEEELKSKFKTDLPKKAPKLKGNVIDLRDL